MSEDIRKWTDGRYTLMFDEHTFFVWDNEKEERMTALNVTKKLNEQQSTIEEQNKQIEEWEFSFRTEMAHHRVAEKELQDKIREQQATIRRLQDLCGESDSENAKLRIENKKLKAKLKEKEEDEKLYANEIVELRKTNEEWLEFKELGGDY